MNAQSTSSETRSFNISDSFSLDFRSLALFRIGLACMVLVDLLERSANLRSLYTDQGAVPRKAIIARLENLNYFSFHLGSGTWQGQTFLFLLAAFFAVMLLFGARTRFATFASWVMMVSLHDRAFPFSNGGDDILRLALFWSLFLPLGAKYSVDAAFHLQETPPPDRPVLFSYATVGLTLQICFVYFFSVMYKTAPMWTTDRNAIYFALRLEHFATPFGNWLLNYPDLLHWMTILVLRIELFGPLLFLLSSSRTLLRTVVVLLFIGFHAGLGLCLSLDLFSVVGATAWLVFLPSAFWDRLVQLRWFKLRAPVQVFFDEECGFCKRMITLIQTFLFIPEGWFRPAQESEEVLTIMEKHNSWVVVDEDGTAHLGFDAFLRLLELRSFFDFLRMVLRLQPLRSLGASTYNFIATRRMAAAAVLPAGLGEVPRWKPSWLTQSLSCCFLLFVLLWNIRNMNPANYSQVLPHEFDIIAEVTRVDQRWGMFAPPPQSDSWYVAEATDQQGRKVDLLRPGQPLSYEKANLAAPIYAETRWRSFFEFLRKKSNSDFRPYFASYICRNWNDTHRPDEKVEGCDIYYLEEANLLNDESGPIAKQLMTKFRMPK